MELMESDNWGSYKSLKFSSLIIEEQMLILTALQ